MWLYHKKKCFEDLTSAESHELFEKFVKDWNRWGGTVPVVGLALAKTILYAATAAEAAYVAVPLNVGSTARVDLAYASPSTALATKLSRLDP